MRKLLKQTAPRGTRWKFIPCSGLSVHAAAQLRTYLAAQILDVQALQDGDGESTGLASTRLCLGNGIMALHNRDDGTLLDGGRPLETVTCNA